MSELDLDDAIASILGDSDEDTTSKKKKHSSKKKSSRSSKGLTSSVSDEDFYKNLSKISEEQNNDSQEDVKITEDDAKKLAGNLAGLDDMESDLLGSLGRKKVTSPRSKPGHDSDTQDKHHDVKRKASSGSLHRKGSITPFSEEDEIGVRDNNLMLSDDDDENDDVLNSSMNSTTSKHRKVSPNKISPRVKPGEGTKSKKSEKPSRSKEIDFDSDSDLPGLDNKDAESAVKKKPSSRSRKNKKSPDGDLFGDDDDLPDLDGPAKSERPKAASALDSLMGKKPKATADTKKAKPATLDDFMAKVSTTSKTSPKSDVQSPVRSPTSEETFQFGGYMPSSAGNTGRRSRGSTTRPDSDFGRRSVKFSDDLGLDDDLFGSKKRPSTAPGGRKKREESKDPLNNTFTASSSKDKADWLGLDDKTDAGNSAKTTVNKDEDLSSQTSLQGSKSSASGDWLGLGDDVTDDHLNSSLTAAKSPESDQGTMPPAKIAETKQDGELSKMLDIVPDGSKKKTESDDKSLFPWDGGKSPGRRRRPGTPSTAKQDFADVLQDETESQKRTTQTNENQDQTKSTPQQSKPLEASNVQSQTPTKVSTSSVGPSLPGTQKQGRVSTPVSSDRTPFQPQTFAHGGNSVGHATPLQAGFNEHQYRSELSRQNYEVELKGVVGKMQDVENEKYKVEVELGNKLAELETKIRRLEIENDSLKQSLELSKERNKEDIAAIENSHKTRVQTLEESYQRREARQREETEVLVSKHKDTVSQSEREKSDLLAAHARKVSHLEANKLTEIERLNETHRRALDEVRSEHLAEMNHLKKMKEQEISATVTAFSHTKSLQGLMEQVLNSTKQVEDLHHLVEVSHKSSQQERDITMKTKNEYLSQLQDRLLKQQAENDEERTRLQNLVAKMEVQIREHSRKLEEDKWKLNQEDSRLKALRVSLEEERRVTREQLEVERGIVQRTKDEFLSQQRQMMVDMNEDRRTLALERAEVSAAQRGMMSKEKQKHDSFTKLDAEQESARVRLAEDTAALDAREAQLRRDREGLRSEKRIFMDKQDKWNSEKDRIENLGLELEKRAQEIDEVSLEASKVGEQGRKSLEIAQRMQVEISQQASELETRVLLLQDKERQIADERLASLKEKRELEMERRRSLCSRCSQSNPRLDTLGKRELSKSLESNLSSNYATSGGLVTSASVPQASSVHSLPPDLLTNTLDLRRTLRRWSQDKEQDDEFLAKESAFLNSLQDSRLSPQYRE